MEPPVDEDLIKRYWFKVKNTEGGSREWPIYASDVEEAKILAQRCTAPGWDLEGPFVRDSTHEEATSVIYFSLNCKIVVPDFKDESEGEDIHPDIDALRQTIYGLLADTPTLEVEWENIEME